MPPGQTIPMELSYTIAKKVCSPQDFERLACAYLASTQTVNFDAEKAAREFGGGKADSFKRAVWVITKKIKEYKGDKDDKFDSAADHGPPATPSANGGKKRKAATPATNGSAKKGKKARSEDDDEPVKTEPTSTARDEDGEDDFVLN